jgi:hypothetical protein|tara:strand:- start:5348 stop:5689 length:342 start_codon:yes stop_codon:yes gene_type:complete
MVQKIEGDSSIVLTKRTVNKNGDVAYSRDGVRSTVYANKGMFVGEPPDTITLECDVAKFMPVKPGIDPAIVAERAAKAQVRAEKAQAKAVKAAEVAQKAIDNATRASEISSSM